jgi:hypothetical protein
VILFPFVFILSFRVICIFSTDICGNRSATIISFINTEGVELFQIGKDKIGTCTYDTVYIKENNTVAVSSEVGVIYI